MYSMTVIETASGFSCSVSNFFIISSWEKRLPAMYVPALAKPAKSGEETTANKCARAVTIQS